jgi:F420H(2)-dependent quinone reductase
VVHEATPLRRALDAFNRVFTRVHTWTYVRSRGWIGHHWTLAPPSLLLHTTGRRTGTRRSVALVYATDGDRILIVGSGFGRDRPPSWLLNLEANSSAEVNLGRRRMAVVAEIVWPPDDRYPRLFRIVNEKNHDRYDRYTAMTDRPIPVVVLSERDGSSGAS